MSGPPAHHPARRRLPAAGPMLVAVLAASGVAVRAVAAGPVDLLPALARAEVCPAAGGECAPPGAVEPLHRAVDGVRLPPGTASNLYLRLPAEPRLELEFAAAGTVLSVDARTDSGAEQELYRAGHLPAPASWQTATIDLAPFAGQIVGLGLRAGAPAAAADAGISIRRAILEGAGSGTPSAPVDRAPTPSSPRPNVLVYVIDTLRADHLGCYGYDRPTSPRIDEFARAGILFARTVSQSCWTLPSVASILTGLTPPRHGAIGPENALRPDVATLAERLRSEGYTTAAFVTNYLASDVFGLARGFVTFRFYREQGDRRPSVYLRSDALHRRLLRWLARGPREPFLLYVHATDPHFPYLPPHRYAGFFLSRDGAPRARRLVETARPLHNGREQWGTRPAPLLPEDVALLRDLYDGAIRMADDYFGRTLDALAARGLLGRTLVVLTSDHGEEFLEHGGVAHGQTLYAESLHVPLVLRLPGGSAGGRRVDTLAQHVDIVPTILDAAGLPLPRGLSGASLLARAAADPPEAECSLTLGPFALDALVSTDWKVIRDRTGPRSRRFEIYATDRDPAERTNLAPTMPVLLGYARDRLQETALSGAPGPVIPAERLDRLRGLGYVAD